jgi:L-alanine-DL-glutamate epimerase-like enolase superfamily enzyme
MRNSRDHSPRGVSRRQLLKGMAAGAAVAGCSADTFAINRTWPLQTTILNTRVRFCSQSLLHPLIISTGRITELTEAVTEVTVRVDGREATGRGSIYLSDLWAWPDLHLGHDRRDAELRKLCRHIEGDLWSLCGGEAAHPLELGLRLHESVCREKTPPVLARAMCVSPFDAALHDAVGIALGRSAFDFYREPTPLPSADPHFLHNNAAAAIAQVIRHPKRRLRAWYLVGKDDDLERDVGPWIRQRGYRCFKIKIFGRDNAADVARTVEVYRAVKRLGAKDPQLSVDTNEANPDAESVRDYYQRLKAADADAFDALLYFEQPTGRDITVSRYDWRPMAALKPVMLDEGLTSLELMHEALAQGWSGFALKTCKGHSFALTAAAWANQRKMLLSLQDLTNPGLSLIHAAWFSAHIPTMNDVELNSPQFTPAANALWLPRLKELFAPTDGLHHLLDQQLIGLGSTM